MESTGGTAHNINTILLSYILTSKYMRTIKGSLIKMLKIIKLKTILFNIPHFIQVTKHTKITVLNEEEVQQLDQTQINHIQETTCNINNRTTPHHSIEMANNTVAFKQIIIPNQTDST